MNVTVSHVTLEAHVLTYKMATAAPASTVSSVHVVRLSSDNAPLTTHVLKTLFVSRKQPVRYFDYYSFTVMFIV